MNTGTIVLIPFRFTDTPEVKIRPAVVLSTTQKHQDIVVCVISSVPSEEPGDFDIPVEPNNTNGLRAPSVIKADTILQLKQADIVAVLGALSDDEVVTLLDTFRKLVD